MDSNALMTRKRQKICCDLLALVKSWHKKLCHFLRVQPIFLSVDYIQDYKKKIKTTNRNKTESRNPLRMKMSFRKSKNGKVL